MASDFEAFQFSYIGHRFNHNIDLMAQVKQYTVTEVSVHLSSFIIIDSRLPQPWIETECSLGEAPYWEEETNSLRFFDIERQRVHSVDLNTGPSSHKFHELDTSIGRAGPVNPSRVRYLTGTQNERRHRGQSGRVHIRWKAWYAGCQTEQMCRC